MHRTRTSLLAAALALPLLVGCGGHEEAPVDRSSSDAASSQELTSGLVPVETALGTIGRPRKWRPITAGLERDRVAAFSIPDGAGGVVGQMDVFVNATVAGTPADALNAANQGARTINFQDLRHVRREFTDVPGAESAYVNESTYTTVDGQKARSVDQLAIGPDGSYLLVRISSAAKAYDAALFGQVLDSMQLTAEEAS